MNNEKSQLLSRTVKAILDGWYKGTKSYHRVEDGPRDGPVQLVIGSTCQIHSGAGRERSQFKIECAENACLTNLMSGKVVFVSQYNERATASIIAEAIATENFWQELASVYDRVGHFIRKGKKTPPASYARSLVVAMKVLSNGSDWTLRNLYTEYLEVEDNQDNAAGVLAKITGAFESLKAEKSELDTEEDENRRREWAEGRG
jgi:hypothetical protein